MNTVNLVDYELVKELRKIDGKLVIFGLVLCVLIREDIVGVKRIKKLEKDVEDLSKKHNNLAEDFVDSFKEKHKED